MVRLVRFEPPATGFGDQRSGQTELRSCDVRRPRRGAYQYGDGPFTPSAVREFLLVPLEGVEPPTRDLGRRRSIR